MESAVKELILWRLDKARNALREAEANLNLGFYGVCMTRSYYAVLYSMQTANGLYQFDSSKHSGVIAFFRKTFLKTGLMDKELSKIIQETSNHRELQKNAEDIKSGAGQYFTPRPLIRAMLKCMRPEPMKTIADPCCGSGGFFLAEQEYIADPAHYTLDREQKEFLKNGTFYGVELVPTAFKMALMNLYLHNIGDIYGEVPVIRGDALLTDPGYRVDYVLTNPPFGKKSSLTFTNEEGKQEEDNLVYNRQDFWTTNSNKQFNFVQHINTILKADGKAAVVVPDNVLFEGGAGEIVRRKLLETIDLHTILRLPTGIFYKPGVKANVIFFDKRPASAETQTKEVWIYDFRTNVHFTLKQNPMTDTDLEDFISCYHPVNRHERTETWSTSNPDGRWRRFTAEEILLRDKISLDIFWMKDKSSEYGSIRTVCDRTSRDKRRSERNHSGRLRYPS